MIDSKKTIGIVGGGAVGRAISEFYLHDSQVKIYDKYQTVDDVAEVGKCQLIFIAVPTPYKNGCDLTEMDDAVATITSHLVDPGQQIIIIKSTVPPGTTDQYQAKYPEVNFIFSPEFLTEKTAIYDFAHPDKQLVGVTDKTKDIAEDIFTNLPDAPYKKVVPAKVAEMSKYAINNYYAFKVIFGNSLYDFCEKLGLDYSIVHEGLVADARIVDSHFDVLHGGYRGYGGKCLPKDVQALAKIGKDKNLDLGFIEAIININDRLERQTNV